MKTRFFVLCFCVALVSGCSSQQLGSAAYGSLEASECKEKTGGQACDLDERTIDERLINGAPDQDSTDALVRQAEKVKKESLKRDES